jgi:hypothetical protein
MNPDYRKQQIDPDGERGHKERSRIDREVQKSSYGRELETSERVANKYQTCSFNDLQIEIRMNQCAAKDESCFMNEDRDYCLSCTQYIIK